MEQPGRSSEDFFAGIQMGLGTWAWGDRLYWGYGKGYTDANLKQAFDKSLEGGIRFFDTAEVYGQGKSEEILGSFVKEMEPPAFVATKFMPFPWRLSKNSLIRALRHSLKRLGLQSVDLYQIHFPMPPINIETWMDAMTDAYELGLIRGVGVSNYDRNQTQRAYDALIKEGVRLASNQVEYHLLDRRIEKNGLMDLCKDLGVKLIAYSPLAMGMLTGKYTPENPPQGMRGNKYSRKYLQKIQPLILEMRKMGVDHEGKTPAQIALNWVIQKGAIPIPGAKNDRQAEQNAGALGWALTDEEVQRLDDLSEQVQE